MQPMFTQKLAYKYIEQHYLSSPKVRNNPIAFQWVSEQLNDTTSDCIMAFRNKKKLTSNMLKNMNESFCK